MQNKKGIFLIPLAKYIIFKADENIEKFSSLLLADNYLWFKTVVCL